MARVRISHTVNKRDKADKVYCTDRRHRQADKRYPDKWQETDRRNRDKRPEADKKRRISGLKWIRNTMQLHAIYPMCAKTHTGT